MNCHLSRSGLIELARGGSEIPETDVPETHPLLAHLSACSGCRRFLAEQRALTATFEKLAATTISAPPSHLERTLAAEFVSRRQTSFPYWKLAAVIAAIAVALGWYLAVPHGQARSHPPVQTPTPIAETTEIAPPVAIQAVTRPVTVPRRPQPGKLRPAKQAAEEPFVAIPYTLPLDPRERARVVRMEMPVTAFLAVGLAAPTPDLGANAQADVVVGEDGRIHGIRLVAVSKSDRSSN